MIRKKNNTLEWLEFEIFAEIPGFIHGIFLRHGGVSTGSFGTLNVTTWAGDSSENVKENRKRIMQALELDTLVTADQVHGNLVQIASEPEGMFSGCDGLITDQKNWGLLMAHADCQAAIFYDPIHHVVATVHAGWRGQVKNIYKETVEKMGHTFGSKPEDLLVGVSPSLGPENSEFIHFRKELPEAFWPFQIKETYFNLWAIARHQLESLGILPHHIQIAEIDTFANPQDFFSYRREKKNGRVEKITGCHGTVASLRRS
ncbi:MAG: peptidoglycan editing factor PgeF [Verrucomicrobia bacterium]|nr:peptidoglycan editing factor PgeF [Verrucomicrobiota bacterium]